MDADLPEQLFAPLSASIADRIGLHFPPARWADLQRSIRAAAAELGFAQKEDEALRWLSGNPPLSRPQIEILSAHLTVGETYFFRELRHFELLTEHILPEALRSRPDRRLRIWSAACCTGEEPYSLAIWLDRMAPALKDWQISILASDINPRFLQRAQSGIFSRWSFRDAPPWLLPTYFQARPDGLFEILPRLREHVRFVPLNLIDDAYPALLGDVHDFDVIFCRNVLMYFTPGHARRTIQKLHRAQRDGGWLLVGASEWLHLSSGPYALVHLPDGILCQKQPAAPSPAIRPEPPPTIASANAPRPISFPPAPDAPRATSPEPPARKTAPPVESPAEKLGRQARTLANQGKLQAALACCDQWIQQERLIPAGHYLRGLILQELGLTDAARDSFRRALYVDPQFVAAHMALGHLERDRHNDPLAHKHLHNAMELLARYPPPATIPESDGMTAAQGLDMVRALLRMEAPV